MSQISFADAAYAGKTKKTRREVLKADDLALDILKVVITHLARNPLGLYPFRVRPQKCD